MSCSATCGTALAGSFRIDAACSGLVTARYPSAVIHNPAGDASASAPPDTPSPTMTDVTGTLADATATSSSAMAGPTPAASSCGPLAAPGVSISVSTGHPNRSASVSSLAAVRKPPAVVGRPLCAINPSVTPWRDPKPQRKP